MSILEILKSRVIPSDGQKLEKLRSELRLAELRQESAYEAIGDAAAAELPTEDASAKHDVELRRVRALTSAITVVEQRIDAADQRAQAEAREEKREAFRVTLTEVQRRAQALQTLFDALRVETVALDEAIAEAGAAGRTCGDDSLTHRLIYGKSAFEFYLKECCKTMPGCAVGFREYLAPYGELFPRPDEV